MSSEQDQVKVAQEEQATPAPKEQEESSKSHDVGELIAESKAYRKRAQTSESKVKKLQAQLKSIEEQGKWISDIIDSVGMKEASLVGHSQGCLISMECAAQFPDKIKSLSLMGGAGAIPMNPELLDLAEKGETKAVDLMMDWAHGTAGHFGGHAVPGLHHINIGGSIIHNGSVKNALGVDFRACNNYKNGFEAAKKVQCPTINILGNKDRMCPVKEGKKLADCITGSQVEIIPNCGHMILLEEADQALAILKKFITTNHPGN